MTRRFAPEALALLTVVFVALAVVLGVLLTHLVAGLPALVLASAVVATTRPVLAFRSFTEFDWMGFPVRAPIIAESPTDEDGVTATVIADALGVEVTLYLPDIGSDVDGALDGELLVYRLTLADDDASLGDLNRAYGTACFIATSLPTTGVTRPAYLSSIGFRRVGA